MLKTCNGCKIAKPETSFSSRGHGKRKGTCRACCKGRGHAPAPSPVASPAPPPAPAPDALRALVEATRRKPLAFDDLCDRLDLSPGKVRALIESAKAQGFAVRVENGHVGVMLDEPDERVQQVEIAPVVGGRFKVAVISDTHLGSKYCLRAQLRHFVESAYAEGVRHVLHPGDVTDGDYRHGKFEVSHVGGDAQAQDLFETLPSLPGLTYHAITGNHDHTFTAESGIEMGSFLSGYFRERGRHDLRFYGNRSAFLEIGGAIVHLWHPRSGGAYAVSYPLQKKIESYASGEKPHVLLAGHWHKYCHVYERGVHALACPTFQGGGSEFSNSLTGSQAIGGLILEWELTEHGTMRGFRHEYRAYFQRERPHRIDDEDRRFFVGHPGGAR